MRKRIYLTESQLTNVVISEAIQVGKNRQLRPINEIIQRLVLLIMKGVVPLMVVIQSIDAFQGMTNNEKEQIKTEVIKQVKFGEKSDKKKIPTEKENNGMKYMCGDGIVTVYNAVPSQTNSDCFTTSSGFKIDPKNPGGHRLCALERTFQAEFGIKAGDIIYITGTYGGKFDGPYQVQDLMNKRFAGMHKIDILVNYDIKYGGTTKNKNATVYKVTDPKLIAKYKSEMKPERSK